MLILHCAVNLVIVLYVISIMLHSSVLICHSAFSLTCNTHTRLRNRKPTICSKDIKPFNFTTNSQHSRKLRMNVLKKNSIILRILSFHESSFTIRMIFVSTFVHTSKSQHWHPVMFSCPCIVLYMDFLTWPK